MTSVIFKAPAKINLYLDVISKRKDSYHNIVTIFQRIDIFDWIKVSLFKSPEPKGRITVLSNADLPQGRGNTVYEAINILKRHCHLKGIDFRIEIDKRIPIAAGLGGGSSDAARVLLGINRLLKLGLKGEDLMNIAKCVGADVAFFISGFKAALAEGIGDKLTPINQKNNLDFLVVVPPVKILASSVYKRVKPRTPAESPRSESRHREFCLTKKIYNVNILARSFKYKNRFGKYLLYNKLEDVIVPSHPVVLDVKQQLKKTGAEGVLVSGSGPAVFGIYSNRREAMRAGQKIKSQRRWQLFLARAW